MAKNKVVSGEFEGLSVSFTGMPGELGLGMLGMNVALINSRTVEFCQLIDSTSKKSATSAVGRAAVGTAILGPIGIAAALSAKSKGTHLVGVVFKTGEKCLLELDDKLYKEILKIMF